MALWTLAPPQQAMVDLSWSNAAILTRTMTANATPHTEGAWTEWVASTSTEWSGFSLVTASVSYASTTDTSMLLDVAVGAAGQEVSILENVPVGYLEANIGSLCVPVRVPAGGRVSARIQAAQISDAAVLKVTPWAGRSFTGSGSSYQTATAYGADTSTSRGVTVTASASTINTFGSWTAIAATTSAQLRAMVVGVQGNADTDIGSAQWRLEVGFGAEGSEQAVASMANQSSSAEYLNSSVHTQAPPALMLPTCAIPEGARLVARLMTSLSTTTTPSLDVVIIGLR